MIRPAGIETPAILMLWSHPHRSPRPTQGPHDRASLVSAGRVLSRLAACLDADPLPEAPSWP
jgi:hypothetical protein